MNSVNCAAPRELTVLIVLHPVNSVNCAASHEQSVQPSRFCRDYPDFA